MQISRVIIADDHSLIRMALINILKSEFPNVSITEVADCESLLKEVTLQDWDLVISDLSMPGRGGLETLEQIKLLKPDLPVLIVSTHSDEHYAVRVIKAGGSGYVNKGKAPDELLNAVQRIAMGKKYIPQEIAEYLLDFLEVNKKPHELLANREFEIFKLLALGETVSQIATRLSLAGSTVSTYRSKIMKKMNFTSNSNLTRYAIVNNIISG